MTATLRGSLILQLSVAAWCALGMAQRAVGQKTGETSPPAGAVDRGKLPEDVERVLWWLPETTEAVLLSKGNVPIMEFLERKVPSLTYRPKSPSPPPPKGKPAAPTGVRVAGYEYPTLEYEYQDLVAESCIWTLRTWCARLDSKSSGHKLLKPLLGPKTARLFATAVWWEKDSTRETCGIIVFSDNTAGRIIESLAAFPNTRRTIGGVSVLEVDLNHGLTKDDMRGIPLDLNELGPIKPKWRWLASPRPNVYVSATSRELMRVILERMKRRGAKRALPADLPEWRHLDPTVPAWGLRHYRAETAKKDCLSMLKWDPQAKGLILFGGSKPSSFIGLRYVSNSTDADSRFRRMQADWMGIKDINKMAPIKRISANCVESLTRINVPLAEIGEKWYAALSAESTRCTCMPMLYLPYLGLYCPLLALKSE